MTSRPRWPSGLKLRRRNSLLSYLMYTGFSLNDADARTTHGYCSCCCSASQGRDLGDPSAELTERQRRGACGASAGIASRPMSLATMQGLLGSVSGVCRWHGEAHARGRRTTPCERRLELGAC